MQADNVTLLEPSFPESSCKLSNGGFRLAVGVESLRIDRVYIDWFVAGHFGIVEVPKDEFSVCLYGISRATFPTTRSGPSKGY